MVHPRRRRSVMAAVNRLVMDGVQAADIVDFAFRTVRSVSNQSTGEKLGSGLVESEV